jgi:hypothetical protein
MVSSLSICGLGGIFGIFGKNICFLDQDYHFKIPHILTLIFSENSNKYHQDRKNFAPEIN